MCRYHLQEAGATPVQEIAYALATAIAVLDAVRESGQVSPDEMPAGGRADVVLHERRASASSRRCASCGRSAGCGTGIAAERYGVTDAEAAPVPLRHAGQLARPDRGAAREQRAAHRARDARRHAVEATRGPEPSSCPPGTRRSACRRRGTSSGRCASSRSWRTRPTCSSTRTCSTARGSWRPRSPSSSEAAAVELDWVLDGGGSFEMIDDMKGRLVAEPRRATCGGSSRASSRSWASTRSPRPSRRRCSPSDARAHLGDRPGRRGGPDRAISNGGGPSATARPCSARSTTLPARRGRPTRTWCRPRSRSPRPAARSGSGPTRCATCSASTGRPPGSAPRSRPASGELLAVREQAQAAARRARRPAPAPRGQARPRRALQRRRADRRRGPRRRHRGHLPGDPPHPGRDRGRGPRRGRRRRRAVDPVGLAPASWCADTLGELGAAGVDAPVVVGGIIPDADQPALRGHGRGARSTRRRTSGSPTSCGDLVELAAEHRRATRAAAPAG